MRRLNPQLPLSADRIRSRARRLRGPESGVIGQVLRFSVAGGVVAAIYMGTTTVLANLFDVPFQLALALGFATAVVAHFTLQRFFVWIHNTEFALPLLAQARRYALVSGTQYGTTVLATALLPRVLDLDTTVVFVAWTICVSVINFVVFSRGVFHAGRPEDPGTGRRPASIHD